MESFKPNQSEKTERDVRYEKRDIHPQVVMYIFNQIGVVIDSSNKNQKEYPELTFGTFDSIAEGEANKEAVFTQPDKRRDISMKDVADCIEIAVRDYGSDTFWIHPSDEDGHGAARLRLYRKFANIEPDGNDFGYILRIKSET